MKYKPEFCCHPDCEHCPYPDCTYDGDFTEDEIKTISSVLPKTVIKEDAQIEWRKAYHEKYYAEHKEERRIKRREYYLKNREHFLMKQKEYDKKKREKKVQKSQIT